MKNRELIRRTAGMTALAVAAGLVGPAAHATEGYFALGHSPVQRSLAGAGVARGSEAMSASINPAGVADVPHQFQLGAEAFMPFRGFEGTGTGFLPSGTVDSDRNIFFVPSLSYNRPLDNGGVFNFSVYGNGGMNTTYPDGLPGANTLDGSVFGTGPAGVDLIQLFASATYAQKFGNVSVGIAPTVAVQGFKAEGLGALAGISNDFTSLSDNGYDISVGVGIRGGLQVEVTPGFRIGVAGQSKMYMTEFDQYAGLFENGGDFDIPAMVSAGVAVDVSPNVTVMADYRRIFYSDVGAIGNPNNGVPLGAPGGAGFGWDDVDAVKVGVEWRQSDSMTWRAGYSWNSNPIESDDVLFNILAPAVVQHHISLGGTKKLNDRDALDFSITYVPEATVSGPVPIAFGGGTVEPFMSQFTASVGWTRTF